MWYNDLMRIQQINSQTAKIVRLTKKEVAKMFELELSEATASTSASTSKYDSLFTKEEHAVLDLFRTYLIDGCGFQKSSASSYRANFMRARSKSLASEELNSDERSARKKFDEFLKHLGVSDDGTVENTDEDAEELIDEVTVEDIDES